jgi:hypothetical protein
MPVGIELSSYTYNLKGHYKVEEVNINEPFYKLTKEQDDVTIVVYVPKSDVFAVEGLRNVGGRRNCKATKNARRNKRRYTRRN